MVMKLTITPCNLDAKGSITGVRSREAFEVMLNPTNYEVSGGINYSAPKVLGQAAKEPKFVGAKDMTVKFNIILDNTGVVPRSGDVKDKIEKLGRVCYDYVGNNHEPNVVKLVWGSFNFNGRLTTISTDYTLFKPSGEPLRAKVDLTFTKYTSAKEEAAATKKSSPDLTHLVEVKAGDSLPLLCFQIYKDSSYYLQVAKSNGITNFRDIKPGTKLNFPPLR
ncbi:MAG: CIS tube protein [Burkholderiales bacterium]